jgi:hypothetical protein
MKNLFLIISLFTLFSCSKSLELIGNVNVISHRNFEVSKKYELIRSNANLSKKELKRKKAPNIEQAIDDVVKSVPGGEFLTNAKIYVVNGKYYAVEGDVYGNNPSQYKGFSIGDKVQWKSMGSTKNGTVTSLLSDKEAAVKKDSDGVVVSISYDDLLKTN